MKSKGVHDTPCAAACRGASILLAARAEPSPGMLGVRNSIPKISSSSH